MATQGTLSPAPFRLAVPENELVTLKARLAATRWPDQVETAAAAAAAAASAAAMRQYAPG